MHIRDAGVENSKNDSSPSSSTPATHALMSTRYLYTGRNFGNLTEYKWSGCCEIKKIR